MLFSLNVVLNINCPQLLEELASVKLSVVQHYCLPSKLYVPVCPHEILLFAPAEIGKFLNWGLKGAGHRTWHRGVWAQQFLDNRANHSDPPTYSG